MRKARSARGELVDFDLLAIKKQLATAPVAVGVDDRRRFIDEKDGVRTTKNISSTASALELGQAAMEASAEAVAPKKKK
jgi:hypothetical protein